MTKPKTKSSSSKTSPAKLPRQAAPDVAAVTTSGGVDEHSGVASLERVRPELLALAATEVTPLTLNLRVAALAALGIYGLIESLGLHERMLAMGKIGEFETEQLLRLTDLARATFYCRLKVEQMSAVLSSAMVPVALATRGQELRRRMMKVLDFHFADDPKVGPKLDFIRSGNGYQDLAEDLLGVSEQYREHKAAIKETPVHYKASDEKDAATVASEIMAWLGSDAAGGTGDTELGTYTNLSNRAGVLMIRAYDEVAAAARYLCRNDPELAARFQSLHTLSRSPASSPTPEPPTGEPAPA